MMIRLLCIVMLLLAGSACISFDPPDRVSRWLEAGEVVKLRIPARLLHGHDMQEPSYESPQGYQPIPTYQGELLLTDRRLLFVDDSNSSEPSRLSVPYEAVARSRPSQTPLLHYLVIWDAEGHSDSFVVDRRHVRALHQLIGQELFNRTPATQKSNGHAIKSGN